MIIMECRYEELNNAIAGLNASGVPLVALNSDTYTAAGLGDNLGIHYFIPWLAKTLGISVDHAINVFFGGLLLVGGLIAICCFFLAFRHWTARLISTVGILLLTKVSFHYSDVYIAFFFAVASIIPIFILLYQKFYRFNSRLILSIAFSGLIIGYSNFIRSYAGTGVLLFLFSWIFLDPNLLLKDKLRSIIILIAFVSIPYAHFKFMECQRDRFLTKNNPTYQYISDAHTWHSIYIGLGYCKNKYGIEYDDTIAWRKARSINPNVIYCSNEYEQILKDQCFLLAKTDPIFVLKTTLMKIIVLLLKFLSFVNFGILFYFYVRPSFRCIIPFLVSASFYSLPGILVIPNHVYVAGMTSVATIFGIYMICLEIEKFRSESSMKYASVLDKK